MIRASKAVALVAICVCLVAGLLSGGALGRAAAQAAPASQIRWGSCHNRSLPSGYQCATLSVPVDGQEPGDGGPSFPLALARHRASGKSVGSLLVDPGGPGVSGVDDLPALVSLFSSTLVSHFDVIGFDPPGVGASDPVVCLGSVALGRYLNLDPAPPTAAGRAALVAGNRAFAQGCQARSGRILPHVSTVAAARDMDRIRRALGESQLTYFGFSYGTFLGATYAELYPRRVRAMVLDGALDPALGPVPMIEQQAQAIDGQFRQMVASCAASSSCSWPAPGKPRGEAARAAALSASFQGLVARVRAHPVLVSEAHQTVGPAELLYGTAAGLYSTATWGTLESALAALAGGDGSPILSLFDSYVGLQSHGTYQNTFEAEAAVDCLDAPAPSIARIEADGPGLAKKAPVFGLLDLYSELTCSVWPVHARGTVGPIHAAGAPPIVVVGSTGDPITPYAWSVALAHQLDRGVLLTRVGDGHTGYGASSCVRQAVDHYLIDVTPPRPGERCSSS